MSRMVGQKAVVVGGGQQEGDTYGNGRAIAVTLAREGAEVFVIDHRLDRAQATVDEIVGTGGVAHAHEADVSFGSDCANLIESAIDAMGHLDTLVNNVGIASGDASAVELTESAWDAIMNTNLKSTWLISRAALPHMRERRSGAIINISSTASRWGATQLLAYGISKAGVNALSHALARENAPFNIRVNTVLPGRINTPMGTNRFVSSGVARDREQAAAIRASQVLMGREGQAMDIANAVLFLAYPEASYITGVELRVDGGNGTVIGSITSETDPARPH